MHEWLHEWILFCKLILSRAREPREINLPKGTKNERYAFILANPTILFAFKLQKKKKRILTSRQRDKRHTLLALQKPKWTAEIRGIEKRRVDSIWPKTQLFRINERCVCVRACGETEFDTHKALLTLPGRCRCRLLACFVRLPLSEIGAQWRCARVCDVEISRKRGFPAGSRWTVKTKLHIAVHLVARFRGNFKRETFPRVETPCPRRFRFARSSHDSYMCNILRGESFHAIGSPCYDAVLQVLPFSAERNRRWKVTCARRVYGIHVY